jgi:hypothetical protein
MDCLDELFGAVNSTADIEEDKDKDDSRLDFEPKEIERPPKIKPKAKHAKSLFWNSNCTSF